MRSGRPTRGLVSFYLDTGPSGNFDRKNATQRIGRGVNLLWTFFPTTVAVVFGTLWMTIDSEMKKHEKFRQLSRKEGCRGASSLCLDYHSFWIPFSVIQAIRYQQWPVACSSIGYTLALIAIPNIQNYSFKWVVFSGGHFEWGATYSWQSGQLDPYWTKVLLDLLALNLLCSLCLFPFARPRAFVTSEPGGIMTVAELVWDKTPADFSLEASYETAPFTEIASVLWDQRFLLDQNLRSLTPISALRQGFQTPLVLFTDFSSSRSILEIFLALEHGHTLLATVMLTSFLAALYTVLLGALQVSASFYGATTFASDLACAIATLALNTWFLITSVAVGWNYCGWRYHGDIGGRRFLTRDPATMGAMMPFLLSSEKLREDVAAVRKIEGRKNKIRWLEEQGRRYGFGRFSDREGMKHVGIERNETVDGGRAHVWT
ncbi:MAG: hypothetical protein Q9167_007073 [Letrouitia subvulpina]